MSQVDTSSQDLWYRNKLVWLVIAIPALTVAGCALTIFLAVTNPYQLIVDQDEGTSLAVGE
jgi:hypothetical protein